MSDNHQEQQKEHVLVAKFIGGQRLVGRSPVPPEAVLANGEPWFRLHYPCYVETGVQQTPTGPQVQMGLLPVQDMDAVAPGAADVMLFPLASLLFVAPANETLTHAWREVAEKLKRGPSGIIRPHGPRLLGDKRGGKASP